MSGSRSPSTLGSSAAVGDGRARSLEADQVRSVILGEFGHLHEGDEVRTAGRLLEVPVGDELLGRIVNPLGVPLDDKGPIKTSKTLPVEKIAPGVITRQRVDSPVQTGIKAIDAMIPIGRGQRELIIGDRFTGKTTVLLDTIINQKGKDLYCIYVAIGQNAASIARVAATLEEAGAMEYTIIVAATANDPAALQFIAPYAGCAMGEYFMDEGKDAMCCYDDLTKQAWAYRPGSARRRRRADEAHAAGVRQAASRPGPVPRAGGVRPVRLGPRHRDPQSARARRAVDRAAQAGQVPAGAPIRTGRRPLRGHAGTPRQGSRGACPGVDRWFHPLPEG